MLWCAHVSIVFVFYSGPLDTAFLLTAPLLRHQDHSECPADNACKVVYCTVMWWYSFSATATAEALWYIYIYHTVTSHHIIPATTCSLQMLCHGSIGSFGQRNSNYVVFFFCRLYKNTALHFFQFIFSGCRPRLTTLLSGGAVANAVVDTYAERVLSVCQRVKSQLAGLVTDYHSYQESHQQLSQCQWWYWITLSQIVLALSTVNNFHVFLSVVPQQLVARCSQSLLLGFHSDAQIWKSSNRQFTVFLFMSVFLLCGRKCWTSVRMLLNFAGNRQELELCGDTGMTVHDRVTVVADDFSKTSACMCAVVRIMSWYSDLSTAVYDWSNCESSLSNHVVADMFESANGVVSAIGSKLRLLIQVECNTCLRCD